MRKYLASILVAGGIYLGASLGTVIAEDKQTTIPQQTLENQNEPANKPDQNLEYKIGNTDAIVEALKQSGECEKVYVADFKYKEGIQKLVICEENIDGKAEPRYSINLDNMSEVRISENMAWYVFEWMIGDDVIVKTKDNSAYAMRFWDKSAEKVYNALSDYIKQNKIMEENKNVKTN
jgi:hypothetical protein